jgi:hypothetical protein
MPARRLAEESRQFNHAALYSSAMQPKISFIFYGELAEIRTQARGFSECG